MRRRRKIRSELKRNRLDALIVTSAPNVTYLTDFRGEDSWAVVTLRNCFLVTDSRYTEQARKECIACRIIERPKTLAEAAAKIIAGAKSLKSVGLEETASLQVLRELKKHLKLKVTQTQELVERARSRKDARELGAIRVALRVAQQALGETLKRLRPGIKEYELAAMLDFEIHRRGCAHSFDTIVCFGANASRPHHRPTAKKLRRQDTILIDFGVRYNGYCCDVTRCFAVGKPSSSYETVYRILRRAQQAAMEQIRNGAEIAAVDAAAREVLAKNGLPVYGHGTGHGLGLQIHELPMLARKGKGRLETGQTVTVEPGVYMPGKLGVRLEDDVLVTQTGCVILSRGRFPLDDMVPVLKL